MARAVRKAKPGTTITLAPGTYREPLHIVGRGTQDAPVIVAANPPGSVKFTGGGQIELTGEHLIVSGFDFDGGAIPLKTYAILFRNCHHCRLTNCKIRRYEPIEGNIVQWVRFTTGHHNRIDHCEIHDKSDFGEMVRVTNFTEGFDRIDHNYLHDFIRTPPKNGGEAIRLGTNGSRRTETTVDHNLFERIRAESEIISVKSNGNHFTSNTFRDCFAELTIRQGEDNVVTGNVFTASSRHPGGGVRTYGKRNRIQDNDFEGLDTGIRLGAGSADGKCYAPADDTIVRGNRFSDVEREIIFNDKLHWKPNPNCPPNDIPARGQIIEKSNTPADLSRAYLPSDPCIGPDW